MNPDGTNESKMVESPQNIVSLRSGTPLRVVPADGLPLCERSNESLMLAHGSGSEEAFEELVRRHRKGVLNFMYRMVQNRQIGEELTQDVFLALVKNAHRYIPTAKFTTYLYSIASNIVSKEWARAKRRPVLFAFSRFWGTHDESEELNPLDSVSDSRANVVASFERDEVSAAVNQALRRLPPAQRQVFVLHRFQGLPYDEIANIIKVPVGTVKSRIVRAERALRPLLEEYREYV